MRPSIESPPGGLALTVPAPIPVTIIGGFLGAGKTTLLNHVLSENHGVRAGVLVNDFGAINIDAKLVVGVEGETVRLENGCVCCNIRDDLIAACVGLLQSDEPPEMLLIETSGVSDPAEVAGTFASPDFAGLFSVSTVLTLVDAEQLPGLNGEMVPLARAQIRAADIVILNKVDLVGPSGLESVRALIREVSPRARILDSVKGNVPLELVLERGDVFRSAAVDGAHHHRDHAHHHHDQSFETWHWRCDQKLSLPRVQTVLEALPDGIYRAKGFLYTEELPVLRVVLQLVGRRFTLTDTDGWGEDAPGTELVMIAARGEIDADAMRRAFEGCIGTGDDANSPVLRLVKKFAPHYLDETRPKPGVNNSETSAP